MKFRLFYSLPEHVSRLPSMTTRRQPVSGGYLSAEYSSAIVRCRNHRFFLFDDRSIEFDRVGGGFAALPAITILTALIPLLGGELGRCASG